MTLKIASFSASAIAALSISAFAQAPSQGTARPPSTSPAVTPSRTPVAAARDTVTITGCVEREADYRAARDQVKGGPAGSGLGQGNEYILTHATTGAPVPTSGSGNSESLSYLLTGSAEKDAGSFLKQRVELTGHFKESDKGSPIADTPDAAASSANTDPDGAPRLRTFEVTSVRASAGSCK
jgi:hypothetical protein